MPLFDIFKSEKDGGVVWVASAQTLEIARLKVKSLMASSPGSYVIVNQETGQKLRVNPDGSTERTP